MKTRTLISLILFFVLSAHAWAALVGAGGYTNRFDVQPPPTDWATLNVSGNSSDNYDTDLDVNARITASGVSGQTSLQTGNPPTANTNATLEFERPLPSNSGHGKSLHRTHGKVRQQHRHELAANHILLPVHHCGLGGRSRGERKGLAGLLQFHGVANSWTNILALNTTASANGSTNYRAVINATWANGGNLFLLWVDDNASGSGVDSGNQIDNFYLPASSTDEFLVMLDELEAATTPTQRGFDQGINSFNNIGNRVVAMIGSAETWDAYGTPALRSAVIARWRTCWAIEGAAMLRGLVPETSLPAAGDREGRRKFNSSRRQFVRRII